MIVLYPVFVLSVIAGTGIVYAEDAAPASTSAPADAAASAAAEAAPSTTAPQTKTDAPPVTAVAPANETPAPSKAEVSKTNAKDIEDAPMADDYSSDNAEKTKLASTLDRITKALDSNPSPSKGTAAVPLMPGKNYDFFLLKVPKRGIEPEKTPEKTQAVVSRNLEPSTTGNSMSYPSSDVSAVNSMSYPSSSVSAPQQALCPCAQPPPQVAPDLTALQNLFGNALSFNGLLDPSCPPGQVPVGYQAVGQAQNYIPNNMMIMRMMPAIDGIPVMDFNSIGQSFYNQYTPSLQQQPTQNYYPIQNPYIQNIAAQYHDSTATVLQYPQNGGFPAPYPQHGALQSAYPQNGALPSPYPQNLVLPQQYPQNFALPPPYPQNGAIQSAYPQNGALPSPYPQNLVLPQQYPQNFALPPPYPQNGAIQPPAPQNGYNPITQYQQYDQSGMVPYGQSQVNPLFGYSIQPPQPLSYENVKFPESLIPYDKRDEFKSSKSLFR